MRQHTVECPTGLVVTVRSYKVTDEDTCANPANVRKGIATTSLLNAITLGVDDLGPYSGGGVDDLVPWSQVLYGDRMVVLLKNRIFTWGSEFREDKPCPNCREPTHNEFDLSELKLKPLPTSSRPHVLDEVPLCATLPICGRRVEFRLLRGKDERAIQRLAKQKRDQLSTAYLRYRVQNVEGVKQPDLRSWVNDMDGADSAYLRAAFHDADCGVDQEAKFYCDDCGHMWKEDLQFDENFLFPKYLGKISTNKSVPSSPASPTEPTSA